jgi:O-antigen ligase
VRQVIARTLRAAVTVLTLTLAQSVFWSPQAPWRFSALVASLSMLTAWRPAWGLLALAGLAPFGRMLAVVWLGGFPIRGAEALALACLAGAAVRWTIRPRTGTDLPASVTIPWLLFAASAVASAAVLYRVSQVYLDAPGVFAGRLLTFLTVGYHDLPGDPRPWAEPVGFGYVTAAAFVVEGVALVLIAGRMCAQTAGFARRLLVTCAIAGAVAAAMSLAAVVGAAASGGLDAFIEAASSERWSVHVTKVNTAGSYFVLTGTLGVGLCVLDRTRRLVWLALTAIIVAGLWLTASLAAILSGFAVGIAWAARWLSGGRRDSSRRAIGLTLVLILVTLASVRMWTRSDSLASFERRVAITGVSLDMVAERPLFGVGIDSYSQRSLPYVTEAVRTGFGEGSMEAHNYVMQIAAELGLFGLGCYLCALLATFRQVRRVTGPGGPWATPAAAAIAAFLLSALAGQPMLVDAVAIPVWLVMGVLAGGAPASQASRGSVVFLSLGLAILAASIPLRMQREVGEIDPRRAGYGTTLDLNASGRPVHWLQGPATVFASASAPALDVEVGYGHADAGEIFLRVSGAGLRETVVVLPPAETRAFCMPVEPTTRTARGFRAVTVAAVTATGAPAPRGAAWILAVGRDRPCGA